MDAMMLLLLLPPIGDSHRFPRSAYRLAGPDGKRASGTVLRCGVVAV